MRLNFGPDLAIYTVSRKGELLRRVGLSGRVGQGHQAGQGVEKEAGQKPEVQVQVQVSHDSTSSPMVLVKSR